MNTIIDLSIIYYDEIVFSKILNACNISNYLVEKWLSYAMIRNVRYLWPESSRNIAICASQWSICYIHKGVSFHPMCMMQHSSSIFTMALPGPLPISYGRMLALLANVCWLSFDILQRSPYLISNIWRYRFISPHVPYDTINFLLTQMPTDKCVENKVIIGLRSGANPLPKLMMMYYELGFF